MNTTANFANILSDALTNSDPHVQLYADMAVEALRNGDISRAYRLLDIQEETI